MYERWLSLIEACFELRLSEREIKRMLGQGILVGIRVPLRELDRKAHRKWQGWRILDPGLKFRRYLEESQRRIEHIPLVSGRECGEVLGITPEAVRQMKRRKQIEGKKCGNATLYSVNELRRYLIKKENRQPRGRCSAYSSVLITWLRGILERDQKVGGEVLDRLLRQAVALPEPLKSEYVVRLWDLFDTINRILREIEALRLQDVPGDQSDSRFLDLKLQN